MELMTAIENRRSIRRFKKDPIPRGAIEAILDAARLAPSGKNLQPWQFIVVQGNAHKEMCACLDKALENRKAEGMTSVGSAAHTFNTMKQAPVTVFLFSRRDSFFTGERSLFDEVSKIVDTQSIGAAIEHMLLKATELGLGSLWICDTFYAYGELCAWLQKDALLIAAVTLGMADEAPEARPRRTLERLVEWRD